MKWEYLGRIKDAKLKTYGGVYLLTHHGRETRVVYVGTSNCIGRRISQHYEGYRLGHRTVWRVGKDGDVYEMMSSYGIRNYVRHFKSLANQNKLWASTTLDKIAPKNLLKNNQTFDSEWQEFIEHEYLPNIGVWALKVDPYDAKEAVLIESAIQRRLVSVFDLGRFFNTNDISILGKIEFNRSLIKVKKEIDNVPELDEASQLVFRDLGDKRIPDEAYSIAKCQLKELIDSRLKDSQQRRKKTEDLRLQFPKHGAPWSRVDLEKLRVMLIDYNMEPVEMEPYLERSEKSIKIKIEKNDKFTNRRWREDVDFL